MSRKRLKHKPARGIHWRWGNRIRTYAYECDDPRLDNRAAIEAELRLAEDAPEVRREP